MASRIYEKINLKKDVEEIKKMLEDKNLPKETRAFFEYTLEFAEGDLKDIIEESKNVEEELDKKGELNNMTREEATIKIAGIAVDNVNRAKKEKEEETAMAENKVNDNVKHNVKQNEEVKVSVEVPAKDNNDNSNTEENNMLENNNEINLDTAEVAEEASESMPFWKKVLIIGGVIAAGFAGYKAYQHFTDDSVTIVDDAADAAADLASTVVEA